MDKCKFWTVYLPNKKIEGNLDSTFMAGTRTRLKYNEPEKKRSTNYLANFFDLERKVLSDPSTGSRTFKDHNRCLRYAASVPRIRFPTCIPPKKETSKVSALEHLLENSLAFKFPVSNEVRKQGAQKFLSDTKANEEITDFNFITEPFRTRYCRQAREKDYIRAEKWEQLNRGLKTLIEMDKIETKFGIYHPRQHVSFRLKQGQIKRRKGELIPCYTGPCKGIFRPEGKKEELVRAKAARDGFENVLFYMNNYPALPNLEYIDEILDKWWGDYSRLEVCDTYIMWLFPVPQDDGGNCLAFPLRDAERKVLLSDAIIGRRFIKSYRLMLDFYGFRMTNKTTGEVKRASHWLRRFTELASYSSQKVYVWIGRILTALGMFGFEKYKKELLVFLMDELFSKKSFPDFVVGIMKNIWIPTLCKAEMEEFYHLFDVLTCSYYYRLIDMNIVKKFKAFRKKKYLYDDQRGKDMHVKLNTIVAKSQGKPSKYKKRKRRIKLKVNERGEIYQSEETDNDKDGVYQYNSDISVQSDDKASMPPETKQVLKLIRRNKEIYEAQKKSKRMMLMYATANNVKLTPEDHEYVTTPARMPKLFNVSPTLATINCEYVPYGI